MKFIFIYGPPASGKYTVGRRLAERTDYKFFHNHITVDVVRVLFADAHDNPDRTALLDNLRVDVIETAARLGLNLIFTLAYERDTSDAFVARIIKTVTRYGGEIHFVQLHPPVETLFERIEDPSRFALAKPTDPIKLRSLLAEHDLRARIEYSSSITIDTAAFAPAEATQQIIDAFGL
jgi:gluconate kinase